MEKQIQDSIIQLFQAKGLYVQRVNTGLAVNYYTQNFMALAAKGHSDLVACDEQGRICFLEIKNSSHGTLSLEQCAFLREQHRRGRRWAVCASYEDALRFLADETYHGPDKYAANVLDETKRFIPTQVRRGRSTKMSTTTVAEAMRWNAPAKPVRDDGVIPF